MGFFSLFLTWGGWYAVSPFSDPELLLGLWLEDGCGGSGSSEVELGSFRDGVVSWLELVMIALGMTWEEVGFGTELEVRH